MASADEKKPATAPVHSSSDRYHRVYYGDRLIYRWHQSLSEVSLIIEAPPGVSAKQFDISFTEDHITVGLKGSERPYLDEPLGGLIVRSESFWTLEDGELIFHFQKAVVAETWQFCTAGQAAQNSKLDDAQFEKAKQQILLERFQREHPGFDFSNASVSGSTPDPRNFLGGFDREKVLHGK